MATTALHSIRVLDLTQALAGPYCAQLLGDLGADVIKIEHPRGGDQARGWGPPFLAGESAYFMGTNRNKRSLTLDLKQPAGREILWRLVDEADVLIHNVPRASSRRALGIDAETLMVRNPRLIWVSITGFGLTGPEAEKPGYDVLAQAMSGTMALTGEPDQGPVRFPTPMADITTGVYAALGILAALFERERSGRGQVIDMALLDSQLTWLANVASAFLMAGVQPRKLGNAHPNLVPYQPFEAADGWFIVAVGSERLWQRFLDAIEAPDDLRQDPRFATNADRVRHRDVLVPRLAAIFKQRPVAAWLQALEAAGVPCGPILRPEEALAHPHVLARNMVWEMEHVAAGRVRTLGNPVHLQRTPPSVHRASPLLGEHTEEILRELGYNQEAIETLRREGVIV
ncbi:MAG: CoA transferase [Ardenticatenia bacterium]|nr:MAG: CoA transferase [Ardenticatenia bacterium]